MTKRIVIKTEVNYWIDTEELEPGCTSEKDLIELARSWFDNEPVEDLIEEVRDNISSIEIIDEEE